MIYVSYSFGSARDITLRGLSWKSTSMNICCARYPRMSPRTSKCAPPSVYLSMKRNQPATSTSAPFPPVVLYIKPGDRWHMDLRLALVCGLEVKSNLPGWNCWMDICTPYRLIQRTPWYFSWHSVQFHGHRIEWIYAS